MSTSYRKVEPMKFSVEFQDYESVIFENQRVWTHLHLFLSFFLVPKHGRQPLVFFRASHVVISTKNEEKN